MQCQVTERAKYVFLDSFSTLELHFGILRIFSRVQRLYTPLCQSVQHAEHAKKREFVLGN